MDNKNLIKSTLNFRAEHKQYLMKIANKEHTTMTDVLGHIIDEYIETEDIARKHLEKMLEEKSKLKLEKYLKELTK